MKRFIIFTLLFCSLIVAKADEGMWMLPLIEKLNINKMHEMGCTLSPKDIYNSDSISLKDAVIIFGNGCTGVMVSADGLVLTNHHCGFDAIQQHSTIEHNYLKNGFTAEKLEDEIPISGLTVTFLVRIEDVTNNILSQIPDSLIGVSREDKISIISDSLSQVAIKDTPYTAKVLPFFNGNQFYLFVYEKFEDVRLAFAPPSSIGKFGGDTDNWMWPRHTGDFSIFRVYCSPDGKPAPYSTDNVPYSPKRFIPISNKGYKEDDFTMILGNPGSTSRYLSSFGIDYRMKVLNQARIDVRGIKQDIWRSFMNSNEAIQIAYANKYASSSNYWKNSIGMNQAIVKLKVMERKKAEEAQFTEWLKTSPERQKKYNDVLTSLEEGYAKMYPYGKALIYMYESLINGVELPRIAENIQQWHNFNFSNDEILKKAEKLYKDYYPEVDQKVFIAMLKVYKKSVDADALPEIYEVIQKKFKGEEEKYVQYLFDKSSFTTYEKLKKALLNNKIDFKNDPALVFSSVVKQTYNNINLKLSPINDQIKEVEKIYMAGLMEKAQEEGKQLYPDANFTMRMTYGKVAGYVPADAVTYRYYTTTKGILEKENPNNEEFIVPSSLKKAIENKNFGNYRDKNTGEMQVNFITNNDITGGNSGSPIFNAKGELIGLAFDGNWESLSGDIIFEPDLQRTIGVDIRYMLFVMDKIGNAERLLKELNICN